MNHRRNKVSEMTEERIDRLIKSAYFIGTLAEVISIEIQMDIVDTAFNQKVLNKYAEHIAKYAKFIQRELSKVATPINKEEFTYDHASEFHRFISHYLHFPTEAIREVMDNIEARIKAEEEKALTDKHQNLQP